MLHRQSGVAFDVACGRLCQARGLGMLGSPQHIYLIVVSLALSPSLSLISLSLSPLSFSLLFWGMAYSDLFSPLEVRLELRPEPGLGHLEPHGVVPLAQRHPDHAGHQLVVVTANQQWTLKDGRRSKRTVGGDR